MNSAPVGTSHSISLLKVDSGVSPVNQLGIVNVITPPYIGQSSVGLNLKMISPSVEP